MKYLILLVLLTSAGLCREYRITQYYGPAIYRGSQRVWIAKDIRLGTTDTTRIGFIDIETGKSVFVSMPYTVEEL